MENLLSHPFSHIILTGIIGYIGVVVIIRLSGKRTLSKMNSFDFIITVSLGSILSAMITDPGLSILEGLLAFGTLVLLQYITTFTIVRSNDFSNLIKFEPRLLYYNDSFDRKAMKEERISEREILEAVRANGNASFSNIKAIVLETEGSLSIISTNDVKEGNEKNSLQNVQTDAFK